MEQSGSGREWERGLSGNGPKWDRGLSGMPSLRASEHACALQLGCANTGGAEECSVGALLIISSCRRLQTQNGPGTPRRGGGGTVGARDGARGHAREWVSAPRLRPLLSVRMFEGSWLCKRDCGAELGKLDHVRALRNEALLRTFSSGSKKSVGAIKLGATPTVVRGSADAMACCLGQTSAVRSAARTKWGEWRQTSS
jgi:hypothetical protein